MRIKISLSLIEQKTRSDEVRKKRKEERKKEKKEGRKERKIDENIDPSLFSYVDRQQVEGKNTRARIQASDDSDHLERLPDLAVE